VQAALVMGQPALNAGAAGHIAQESIHRLGVVKAVGHSAALAEALRIGRQFLQLFFQAGDDRFYVFILSYCTLVFAPDLP
jgi:hypothetical protein